MAANTSSNNNRSSSSSRQQHPDDDEHVLFLDRFRANVAQFPEKLAVTFLVPSSSTSSGGGEKKKLKEGCQYTYRQLDEASTAVAWQLVGDKNLSLQRGDRVVLVYPPSLDFLVAFVACCKAGIVAVPVFPPHPNRKDTLHMFGGIVQNCGATTALTNQEYYSAKKIVAIKDSFLKLRQTSSPSSSSTWPDHLKWIVTNSSKSSNKHKIGNFPTTIQKEDICFLQYTSGSTSDPKGVVITHGNLAHNLSIITNELQTNADSTIEVSWLPQYHDMGLIGSYLGCLYCAGTGYYMSPLTFLQRPLYWLDAISTYGATHLQAPNFAFALTARKYLEETKSRPNSNNTKTLAWNFSSVQHVINAAEPVTVDSMEAFYHCFANDEYQFPRGAIIPTYGLAEHTVFVCSGGQHVLTVDKHALEVDGQVILLGTSTTTTTTTMNDVNINVLQQRDQGTNTLTPPTTRLVGCGYPAKQNVDVRIVHAETCQQLTDDTVGEIWINSPSKAAGYFQKENVDETAQTFHAQIVLPTNNSSNSDDNDSLQQLHQPAADGYLRTGDLGFLHANELFICGRLKDLIIVGGRNYYPQDLETTAESVSAPMTRQGCSAAFTIDPTAESERVALVMELKDGEHVVPDDKKYARDVEKLCAPLAEQIRASLLQEHSLAVSELLFLKPRTVPKTSSGKIARAWCRKGYRANALQVVYRKGFADTSPQEQQEQDMNDESAEMESRMQPLELDSSGVPQQQQQMGAQNSAGAATMVHASLSAEQVRAMSKTDILSKLKTDVGRVGNLPVGSIPSDAALATLMDSLNLSQFKGLIENGYHTRLSDEYLFRESTTLTKLTEVVKLGYAPDDGDGTGAAVVQQGTPGKAKGLAGALGCPPGVVCVIL